MKYAIDRIENNIVILEEITTGEKKEVALNLLPVNIKEGNIITYINDEYIIDINEEKLRRDRIKSKFDKLKK